MGAAAPCLCRPVATYERHSRDFDIAGAAQRYVFERSRRCPPGDGRPGQGGRRGRRGSGLDAGRWAVDGRGRRAAWPDWVHSGHIVNREGDAGHRSIAAVLQGGGKPAPARLDDHGHAESLNSAILTMEV